MQRSLMLLSWFLSWCAFVAVRISRLYTYRNRPRVKPVLRLEDRERIEHLVLGARGFVPSKMVHTDRASLYFPSTRARIAVLWRPWILQSCDPFRISVRLAVSRVCRFYAQQRDRDTLGRSSRSSRSKVLRDFFETHRWLVAFWLPSVFSRDTLFYIEEERPSGT